MNSKPLALVLSAILLQATSCSGAPAGDSAAARAPLPAGASYETIEIARFDEPWAMAIEPGTGNIFVTERGGRIKFVQPNGHLGLVIGVPQVDYGGQGGLGEIAFAPDYARSRLVYLGWAEAGGDDTRGAAVGRARLLCEERDSCELRDLRVIWRQVPKVTGRGHFSHRIAFSPDGRHLFIASGERQKFTPAQEMTGNLGKIVRLLPDGRPAPGNPFAAQGGVAAQVWTLGHRNILGLKFDAEGRLWDLEHGPKGGDELNLVEPGRNYGWPLVSNGDHYDGRPIPRHDTRPDFAAPAISWNPVIAPGDFIFYRGDEFPGWRGHVVIAGMIYEGLVRVAIDGGQAREVERIPIGARVREIVERDDGAILLLTDKSPGRLLRLRRRAR